MGERRLGEYLNEAFQSPIVIFALVFAAIVLVLAPFFANANASH